MTTDPVAEELYTRLVGVDGTGFVFDDDPLESVFDRGTSVTVWLVDGAVTYELPDGSTVTLDDVWGTA